MRTEGKRLSNLPNLLEQSGKIEKRTMSAFKTHFFFIIVYDIGPLEYFKKDMISI